MVTDMETSLPSVDEIWSWLDSVSDPEIPVLSVIDLGIVRNVRWTEENEDWTLVVTVTPTYSGCPAVAVINTDIQQALQERGIRNVRLETQLSPAWTTDWMTERGRKRLLEYGIAPPKRYRRKLGLASEARSTVGAARSVFGELALRGSHRSALQNELSFHLP